MTNAWFIFRSSIVHHVYPCEEFVYTHSDVVCRIRFTLETCHVQYVSVSSSLQYREDTLLSEHVWQPHLPPEAGEIDLHHPVSLLPRRLAEDSCWLSHHHLPVLGKVVVVVGGGDDDDDKENTS